MPLKRSTGYSFNHILLLMALIMLSSCREFYDEEFEAFEQERQSRTPNGQGRSGDNASYKAELKSTDAGVSSLSGNARINIRNNEVTVDVDVDGIPSGIIQPHYSYIAADCGPLSVRLPVESVASTRSYTISEKSSVEALSNDLLSSGASTTRGDINLIGKSFVVKAFSNFSGLPNPSGTNQITIVCGEIIQSEEAGSDINDDVIEPPSETTGDSVPVPEENTGTTGEISF